MPIELTMLPGWLQKNMDPLNDLGHRRSSVVTWMESEKALKLSKDVEEW